MPAVLTPKEAASYRGVWVFIEQHEGEMAKVSKELLSKGRELATQRGTELTALLLGDKVEPLAHECIAYGADVVLLAEHPLLRQYSTEPYVDVCARLVEERKPEVLLIGATHTGRDFGSRIAVRNHTGCTADATRLEWDLEKAKTKGEWELIMLRPAFGGKILAGIVCPKHRPWIATARPNTFEVRPPDPHRTGRIERIVPDLGGPYRARVVSYEKLPPEEGVPLEKAEIVVAGGMGLQKKENLRLVEELARELNAAVGASRKIVDAGWISRRHQVGQTGTTIRPRLYIAVGISGAVQHLAGMQEAGFVVSINKDPKAPILSVSDVAIVGDAMKILPALLQEIRRRKGERTLLSEKEAR